MNLPGIGDAHTLLATDSLVAVLSGPPRALERVKTRAGITLPKSSLIFILIERASYIYLSTKLWNWVVDSVLRSPLRFLPGLKPPNGNGHKRRDALATSTWSICSTNIEYRAAWAPLRQWGGHDAALAPRPGKRGREVTQSDWAELREIISKAFNCL
jgi:hypothetical protein